MSDKSQRYEVVEPVSGDRFGNHTYEEAVRRMQAMKLAWQYKKKFVIEERRP